MTTEELANQIEIDFPWIPTNTKMKMAKYVQRFIIEARIDERTSATTNLEIEVRRLKQLKKQLKEVE